MTAFMNDSPQWNNNGFLPDDGYSSPRSSLDEQQTFIEKTGNTQYLKSKLWWLGISLMILGEVGNFVGNCIKKICIYACSDFLLCKRMALHLHPPLHHLVLLHLWRMLYWHR